MKTATLHPSIFLDRAHELGSIEKGKLADLVLLDANPLKDIANVRKVYAVLINGKLLQRSDLDKMLHEANEAAAKR